MSMLEEHISGEEKSLETYRLFLDSKDPVVAMLLGVVLKDEENHHRLLQDIMASISASPYWASKGKAVSPESVLTEQEAERLAATLGRFLLEERESERTMRELARKVRAEHGETYAFVLDLMVLDSKKHERILSFLVERLTPGVLPDYLEFPMTRGDLIS
jgi:hypothetical protein